MTQDAGTQASGCPPPGSLRTHHPGSSPLKSPGTQPPRPGPVSSHKSSLSGASPQPVGRGHNLCPARPSPDFRCPSRCLPSAWRSRGLSNGTPAPPPSEQGAWVPGGTVFRAGSRKGRPGAGPSGMYSCLRSPTLEKPEVGRPEGGGRAGPCPLVGVGGHGNIPFPTQSPPQPPAWMEPAAPSLAISLRDLATVTMATQSPATGPSEKGRGPTLRQGCVCEGAREPRGNPPPTHTSRDTGGETRGKRTGAKL